MAEAINELPQNPEQAPKPGTLDIIKIEGRWAQTVSPDLIKFLDDRSVQEVNWDDYQLVRTIQLSVGDMKDVLGERIKEKEIKNIRWGDEERRGYPRLKRQVRVFGEYQRKQK